MSALERKQKFLQETVKGEDFEFSASETGFYHINGEVTFNDRGINLYTFQSIEDFADYIYLDKNVPHQLSTYVGICNEDGTTSWSDGAYNKGEVEEIERGCAICTIPKSIPLVTP